MSRAAKQSIFILIFLLIGVLVFAGFSIFEKQKLEQDNARMNKEIEKSQEREKMSLIEIKNLKDNIVQISGDNGKLKDKIAKAESQAQELLAQVKQLTVDRDQWAKKIEGLQQDKDKLTADLEQKIKQLESFGKAQEEISKQLENQKIDAPPLPGEPPAAVPAENSDQYWAGMLKDKAAIEVQLDNLKAELAKKTVEISEVNQKNADLKMEIEGLKQEKIAVEQDIQYKIDVINNLSLELAQTKNDKKFVAEKFKELKNENDSLRMEMKKLFMAKTTLEKSIVGLSEDKKNVERQLAQRENVIQSKIDEIWDIKESLDKTFQQTTLNKDNKTSTASPVDLGPIRVMNGSKKSQEEKVPSAGYNGKVVSVNQDNNFVIVNLGEKSGVRVGDALSVYRGNEIVASLQVIQVREEISAADIKEQRAKIQEGDEVR